MTMTTTVPQTNGKAEPIDLAVHPLRLRADEKERWIDFPDEGVSFHEAASKILAAADKDGKRRDLGVGDLSTWAFGPGPDGTASLATVPVPGRNRHVIPLRNHAFTQLCGRIGAPAAYLKKLPGKLQMVCVNHGLQSADKEATMRLAGGEARAILSDRYAVLDNHLVIETLEKTLKAAGMLSDVRVRSIALGATASMRLTLPGDDIIVKNPNEVGDIVEIGLDVLNGELGNRSVSITPLVYRLVCLNGMRRADRESVYRMRHTGEASVLAEKFQDAVPSALASARGLRKHMAKAVDVMVDDILAEFDGLRAFGLGVAEVRDVAADVLSERKLALPRDNSEWIDVFDKAGDITAYDVLNGITHVAQTRSTDRRLEMEQAASKYVYRRVA